MPTESDPEKSKDLTASNLNPAATVSNLSSEPPASNLSGPNANQPKVLSLAIKDLKVLYTAYMPFVTNGGLFIPTKKPFNMGDSLPLIISLMEENLKYTVTGKVIWITPNDAHNRSPGIGVQFTGTNAAELYTKITELLASLQSNEVTNTM